MPINNDIVLQIKTQYQNAGMQDLKTALKDAQRDLDNLKTTGQQGTQVWDNQKSKILGLSQSINALGREYKGLDANVKLSGLSLLEMGENITVVVMGLKQAISGIKNTASEMLNAANKMQSATMGLESIAKYKGIDGTVATESLKNLDLVKNGLLNLSDASLSLKNLLASGFSLEQSLTLIKRFGDAAAFGRQSSLEFGYAISSATEGIKNQNSMLVDNAGVTKNISVIMKEGGMAMEDLTDATKKQSAINVLYNGILKETQGQLGDADKLTKTYAGEQAKLSAQTLQLKQNFGVLLQQALKPVLSTLTSMPPQLQAVAYGLGTVSSTALDLIPTLTLLSMKFGTAFTVASATIGSIAAGIANLAAHVMNLKGLVELVIDMFTGDKWDEVANSWFGKWIGMEQKVPVKFTVDANTKDLNKDVKKITDKIIANTESPDILAYTRDGKPIYKQRIELLDEERKKRENQKDKNGTKKVNELTLENKALQEIIDKYKDKLLLVELESGADADIVNYRREILTDALEELKVNYLSLQYTKDKVKNLQEQKDINELLEKSYGNQIASQRKLAKAFEFGDSTNKQSKASEEKTISRISNSDKNKRIQYNGTFKSTKANEAGSTDYEKAGEKVSAILDVASQTVDILGLGADSFIGKMLSGFQDVLGLADSVVSLLAKFGAIGKETASGGIFGILGGILGFADGGLISGNGTGRSDSILARVSNGEFIINSSAVSQPGILPILQAINGNSYSQIAKYSNGGYVNRNVNNNNVYIGANVDGVQFFKTNEPKYRKYKYSKRV